MNDIRPEIRGGRLLLGAITIVITTYWYLTGRVWNPFAEALVSGFVGPPADGTYGGGISDVIDIITAICYLVGTVLSVAGSGAVALLKSLVGNLSQRFGSARDMVDTIVGDDTDEANTEQPSPETDSTFNVAEIVRRINLYGVYLREMRLDVDKLLKTSESKTASEDDK